MVWGGSACRRAPEPFRRGAAPAPAGIGRIYRLARPEDACPTAIRLAAAAADAGAIEQTRVLISMQLASSVSWPLVGIVVSWALILFCGFGLLSRITGTTLAALGFGAFAVGSAICSLSSSSAIPSPGYSACRPALSTNAGVDRQIALTPRSARCRPATDTAELKNGASALSPRLSRSSRGAPPPVRISRFPWATFRRLDCAPDAPLSGACVATPCRVATFRRAARPIREHR